MDTPDDVRERYILQMQCLTGVNRMIGKLRKKLEDLNLNKNTIIIFTSDHGLFMGEHGLGGKSLCYEKCTHVPIFMYNPKQKNGFRSDALVQTIDVGATILSLGGVKIPKAMQGKDISGFIKREKPEIREYLYTEKVKLANEYSVSQRVMLYEVHPNQFAVYRNFIESPLKGEKPVYEELYHLAIDPNEVHNLINETKYKAILEELRAAWKVEITNARGEGNPKIRIYSNIKSAI